MPIETIFYPDQSREVRLLDGRLVTVNPYGTNYFSSDQGRHRYDYSWRSQELQWHDSLGEILIGLLSTHSLAYAEQCAIHCGFLIKGLAGASIPCEKLMLEHLEDYPQRRPISTWPFVQATLARWAERRLPGLDPQIAKFLSQPEKWEEKGNGWYFALVANNPSRGALTEQELRNVYHSLNQAYANGSISTDQWALCFFLIATGVRPIQIARMKVKDVVITTGPEGVEMTLIITLAKTRDAIKSTRWRRKCPTQLVEVLSAYLKTPKMAAAKPNDPLFFDQSIKVAKGLRIIFDALETHSDRVKGPIPLFPYRFRYTLGTRAIALGARDEEVARLLTHTSLHCVRYYRAAMPALQAPIGEAIGDEMTIFARAFKGRLVESLEEATRKGEESALITAYEHLNGQDLGACGTRAQCYQDAPRGCLTCSKFEPFREASWEALRDILVKDRDTEKNDRIRNITQEQIDAVDEIIAERQAATAL
ncbi:MULTISPECIES: tyrosine-type recombinase/integrase [unclassified Sphingobium]|uniref:tyrosine-type recombinase/integrase n=1 Tax=unclassified Sphingobium TaxID=2611147 RepID=UPI0022241DC0|nr:MULTISPECIES: tyrosine-type recombinase/integrase [unclassified Sphingobium]MCW2393800.1 integrase [Sphingobium sp. B8D3B]MCW2417314.1 integrase [Sphingobium sp. B8D3C]